MQLLYEQMLGGQGGVDTLQGLIEFPQEEQEDQQYIAQVVGGVQAHAQEFDALIARRSPKRALERIPVVVRAILRLALYELREMADIPASVVINEAVALAKQYGEDEDSRFVNGVLGEVVRSQAGQ